jgi:hypothetical protein
MSTQDAVIAGPGLSTAPLGRLEAIHLRSRNYRNAADTSRITSTHWHIAWANGLGWGFDGMDGAILALVAPLLMKEFAIDLSTYRSGVQIALFVSIIGLYLWPWLEAAVFMTVWIFARDKIALWLLGMAWSWGFIGVWGPVTTYTAEMYPTRIRGVGNGFSWAMAFIVGAVLWPFVSVYLRETTGSFVAAFLLIPVILLVMAAIIWFYSPEHGRKELDQISV